MGSPFVIFNVYASGGNFCIETSLTSKPVGNSTKATVTFSGSDVSWSGHNLPAHTPVVFMSTGTLPPEATQGHVYYVLAAGITGRTFKVATSIGGSPITFSNAGSGTHTCVSNALKFRPHPCPKLTAFNNSGCQAILNMNGAIEEPLFSRAHASFAGIQDGNADLYQEHSPLWGNLETLTVDVVRPTTHTGAILTITANAFDDGLLAHNMSQFIDLTTAGKRTITKDAAVKPRNASDTLVAFPYWLSDTIRFVPSGGWGGGLSSQPIFHITVKTDQGITKYDLFNYIGSNMDHNSVIGDAGLVGGYVT
jgi:hypothetical protein